MTPYAAVSHVDPSRSPTNSTPAHPAGCPICAADLEPFGGAMRCCRCTFVLCVGCEPEEMPDCSWET